MNSHDPKHAACRELFAKLSEYMDRELDRATAEEVRYHLGQCPPCQTCLATLKRTVTLCGTLDRSAVPASFSQRLKAMVNTALQDDSPPAD